MPAARAPVEVERAASSRSGHKKAANGFPRLAAFFLSRPAIGKGMNKENAEFAENEIDFAAFLRPPCSTVLTTSKPNGVLESSSRAQ